MVFSLGPFVGEFAHILFVGHVSNVPGMLESCPTYYCTDP